MSEAISTCIRSSFRESDDDSDNADCAYQRPLARPDISEWDPTLFEQYRLRIATPRKSIGTPRSVTPEKVVAEGSIRFGVGNDARGYSHGLSGHQNDKLNDISRIPWSRVVSNVGGVRKDTPAKPSPPSLGRNEEIGELTTMPRAASNVVDDVDTSQRQQSYPRDDPIKEGANDRENVSFIDQSSSPANGVRAYRRRRQRGRRGIENALKLVTRCLQMDALNAKAYALRAELEARLGRRDRAITDFKAAASLDYGGSRSKINQVGTRATQRLCYAIATHAKAGMRGCIHVIHGRSRMIIVRPFLCLSLIHI